MWARKPQVGCGIKTLKGLRVSGVHWLVSVCCQCSVEFHSSDILLSLPAVINEHDQSVTFLMGCSSHG